MSSFEVLQMDLALSFWFLWPLVVNMEQCGTHSLTYLACENVDHER